MNLLYLSDKIFQNQAVSPKSGNHDTEMLVMQLNNVMTTEQDQEISSESR